MQTKTDSLRIYNIDSPQFLFYRNQHENQTYDFVKSKLKQYKKSYNCSFFMTDVLRMMDEFIDPSDPDTDKPNSFHAYQTAESIRKQYPENKALQICGIIHDLGKILFKFNEPSWAVVGDTFVVGCKFPETIVYYDTMKNNIDYNNTIYNTKYGVYKPHCGIRNLLLSVGHDEYLYNVLQSNKNHIFPQKYKDIIRFHSFYPWHTGGSYREFMVSDDMQLLEDVLNFNAFDLYSKTDDDFTITDEIKKYYNNILTEYFPENLLW